MRKLRFISVAELTFVLIAWLALPVAAHADPDIEVSPLEYNFGEVELGASSTTVITISNVGYDTRTVSDISFQSDSSHDFSVLWAPTLPALLAPVNSDPARAIVDVEIAFAPSTLGLSIAVIEIGSDAPDGYSLQVVLEGMGVEAEQPPSLTIEEILAFFDASVAEESLEGCGELPELAKAQLKDMRNMLEGAGDLIEGGWRGDYGKPAACYVLERAYLRSDGFPWSPDYVTGEARQELADKILELAGHLGCE